MTGHYKAIKTKLAINNLQYERNESGKLSHAFDLLLPKWEARSIMPNNTTIALRPSDTPITMLWPSDMPIPAIQDYV